MLADRTRRGRAENPAIDLAMFMTGRTLLADGGEITVGLRSMRCDGGRADVERR